VPTPIRRFILVLAALAVGTLGVPGAGAAPPDVPGELTYQGVLLDDLGQPQTGNVDLVVRLYDQAAGGTLLYKETFGATPLSAGTFTVVLGPTGDASDTPDDPLTTSLADVFTGDLVAGPTRHLELTVDGDPPLARVQVLSAPLALRAASAAQADVADTATTATTVTTIDGVDPEVISQIYAHVSFDGLEPPNDHPSEGLGDADGDGIANFLDPDNDDDGLSDDVELAQGSDLNLTTPEIAGVSPTSGSRVASHVVTVTGLKFEPGVTVAFGAENPAPAGVTATSFDVTVGPQPAGLVSVQVTLPNGESDILPDAFLFEPDALVHGVSPVRGSTFDVRGTQAFLIGRDPNDYVADLDDDGTLEFTWNVTGGQAADYAWDPTGLIQGLRCGLIGNVCSVYALRDSDGDGTPDDQQLIESFSGTVSATLLSASLAFRPDGRPVRAYVRQTLDPGASVDVVVAVDDDGDDDWSDPGDLVELETGVQDASLEVIVDGLGRTAVLYGRTAGGSSLELAYDLTADGDFDDANERQTLFTGATSCLAVASDTADRLAVLYEASGGTPTLIHDGDGDGILGETGETTALGGSSGHACDLAALSGGGLAVLGGDDLRLDRNADGSFDPVLESAGSTGGLALVPFGSNSVAVLTDDEVLSGY
jgi:hypothetical protein